MEDKEQRELSFTAGETTKWYSHFGKEFAVSYKAKRSFTMRSTNAILDMYSNELKTYIYMTNNSKHLSKSSELYSLKSES